MHPVSGSIDVGSYSLEVGGPGGTLIQRRAGVAREGGEPLERVLEMGEPSAGEGAAAVASDVVDDASAVTAKIERAAALGKGVAEGKALSPDLLGLEVGTMLDLLERLDRGKRHKEALRLARALVNLLMLLRRWAELLRTLRAALRAGEKLGDLEAIGWAKHELGTLRIAGGDVEGAERTLHEAREIREQIGDRRELAATNRNLQVLCERLREMLRTEELVRAKGARRSGLRLVALAALFTLLFGVGVAVGVVANDSNGPSGATANGGGGTDSGITGAANQGAASGTNDEAEPLPSRVIEEEEEEAAAAEAGEETNEEEAPPEEEEEAVGPTPSEVPPASSEEVIK